MRTTYIKNDVYKVFSSLDLSEYRPGGSIGGWYLWQDDIDAGNLQTHLFSLVPLQMYRGLLASKLSH